MKPLKKDKSILCYSIGSALVKILKRTEEKFNDQTYSERCWSNGLAALH